MPSLPQHEPWEHLTLIGQLVNLDLSRGDQGRRGWHLLQCLGVPEILSLARIDPPVFVLHGGYRKLRRPVGAPHREDHADTKNRIGQRVDRRLYSVPASAEAVDVCLRIPQGLAPNSFGQKNSFVYSSTADMQTCSLAMARRNKEYKARHKTIRQDFIELFGHATVSRNALSSSASTS